MKKVYLAGGISDTARKNYQKEVARKIRGLEYEVYAASENDSINDKSNDPTPLDIYNGDIERVKESDIFVVCISGGNEDGTLSEIGMVAGWNEQLLEIKNIINQAYEEENASPDYYWGVDEVVDRLNRPITIVAYTINERLMKPQFWNGIASGGFNHLVAGMVDKWGVFVGGEKEMLEYLERLNNED